MARRRQAPGGRKLTPDEITLACRAVTAPPYDHAGETLHDLFGRLTLNEAGKLIRHLYRWREKSNNITQAEELVMDGWART